MAAPPDIQVVETTLQGRAGAMPNAKGEQMFCRLISSRIDLTLFEDMIELTPGWNTDQPKVAPTTMVQQCPRLWLVSLRGLEVYRSSDPVVAPLSRNVIVNGPLPASSVRSQNVHAYRARISVSNETQYAVFDIDLNQDLEVWGQRVSVTIIGPANALSVPSDVPETLTRAQFVVDSLFACQIVPIEQSKGCKEAKFTQTVRSAATTRASIQVPRAASAVKIYQGEPISAAPTIMWERQLASPAISTPVNVGWINFNARTSSDESSPIGLESHLLTDIDPLSTRLFIMNWTIRP